MPTYIEKERERERDETFVPYKIPQSELLINKETLGLERQD